MQNRWLLFLFQGQNMQNCHYCRNLSHLTPYSPLEIKNGKIRIVWMAIKNKLILQTSSGSIKTGQTWRQLKWLHGNAVTKILLNSCTAGFSVSSLHLRVGPLGQYMHSRTLPYGPLWGEQQSVMTYPCKCWTENVSLPPQNAYIQRNAHMLLNCSCPCVIFLIYLFCDTYTHHLSTPQWRKENIFLLIGSGRIGHIREMISLCLKIGIQSVLKPAISPMLCTNTVERMGFAQGTWAWCNETGWQARASGILFCCLHRFASLVTSFFSVPFSPPVRQW